MQIIRLKHVERYTCIIIIYYDTMHKTYLDFLQDQKFLEWKIVGSDELNSYWLEFKAKNPELTPHLEEAEVFLQNYKLNQRKMDEQHSMELLQKIISYNSRQNKRRNLFIFSAISAVAMIFIVIGFFWFRVAPPAPPEDLVVGNQLSDEDIVFISSNKTQSFTTNVQIEIDAKGKAVINDENQTLTHIDTEEKALNRIIVPYGKRTNIQLSDGTKIWLNSGSELEFPAVFPREKREINLLAGEMYIEVAPEIKRRLHVQTPDFQIKVYGTSFNVSIYENYPQAVILAHGEISMMGAGQTETAIYPDQRAVYLKNGEIIKEKVKAQFYTSWKDGFIELYETPVTDILNYVERYYNISFNYPRGKSLNKITCTGKLYLSENIDNVMNSIAILSSTTYENRDGKIYIINPN